MNRPEELEPYIECLSFFLFQEDPEVKISHFSLALRENAITVHWLDSKDFAMILDFPRKTKIRNTKIVGKSRLGLGTPENCMMVLSREAKEVWYSEIA